MTFEVYRLPTGRSSPHESYANEAWLNSAAQHLQKCFDDLLSSDERLADYVLQMQTLKLRAVVFGGWTRDRLVELIRERSYHSRDIDLVAHGPVSVEHALPNSAIRNPFGGFGIEASTMHFDAWDLPNTFLIRRHRLPVTFDQLPFTADYNVNAVLFKPAQFFQYASLLDVGAIVSLRAGVLDFVADEVAQPLVQAARSVILAVRLQCVISETVQTFLRAVCRTKDRRQAVIEGIRNYCKADWTASAISLFESIVEDD